MSLSTISKWFLNASRDGDSVTPWGSYLMSHLSFFLLFPRPAILVAEGDGWTSLCSFADGQAGSMSVVDLPWVCIGVRPQHVLCIKIFLAL